MCCTHENDHIFYVASDDGDDVVERRDNIQQVDDCSDKDDHDPSDHWDNKEKAEDSFPLVNLIRHLIGDHHLPSQNVVCTVYPAAHEETVSDSEDEESSSLQRPVQSVSQGQGNNNDDIRCDCLGGLYSKKQYFGVPRHTQSMMVYEI